MNDYRPVRNQIEAERTIARMKQLLAEGKDVRVERVHALREKITGGQYVNDLKLSVAIDRMLEDFFDEPVPTRIVRRTVD